jgi:hypothetical protein
MAGSDPLKPAGKYPLCCYLPIPLTHALQQRVAEERCTKTAFVMRALERALAEPREAA